MRKGRCGTAGILPCGTPYGLSAGERAMEEFMVPPAESGPCMVKGAPYPVSREVYVGTLLRTVREKPDRVRTKRRHGDVGQDD